MKRWIAPAMSISWKSLSSAPVRLFLSTEGHEVSMMNYTSFMSMAIPAVAILILTGCSGGEPKDARLLRKGMELELSAKYNAAAEKYASAASFGNAEAFLRLGDLCITHDYAELRPKNVADYAMGYDDWIADAGRVLDRASGFYEKARQAGCTNHLDAALERLEGLRAKVAETSFRVNVAKQKIIAEEQRRREEQAKQAALREQEEKRRREAEARQAEIRRQEEVRRQEEQRRRESPEYCIEHNLELTDSAFREIVRAVNYTSNTGNDIYDSHLESEQHARFRRQRIKLTARVTKVETTFFTDEVKFILNRCGHTISARFDGMDKSYGAEVRPGMEFLISGEISARPVTSDIALDRCQIIE